MGIMMLRAVVSPGAHGGLSQIEYRIRFLDVHGHCLIDMPLETMIALDQMLQRPRQLPAGYLMIERMKR